MKGRASRARPVRPAPGPMFKKILIANRGEIACRIIWTCKELGIKTVAVYSEADADALHVRFADEAICIGPPAATQSYLNIPSVIAAAEVANVDAIHPGYGFLSENAYFAEVCEACNIKFIGPPAHLIREMGDKARAKATMRSLGVPVTPGSDGVLQSEEAAQAAAAEIGYPVMIKAAAGGGGRGMRIVQRAEDLADAYQTAAHEAQTAFGNGDLYLEKYIANPHHVEVQVLGDRHGHVLHFGERECSVQRRHQKLLEETPSPILTPALRREMHRVAVAACREMGYISAGTIEFLVDDDENFYFMEMNTRIQVEHAVTEMVTNTDLVRAQVRVAEGAALSFTQEEIIFSGYAMECRINAEDPARFTPSPGRITAFNMPGGPGVRVDTAAYLDYVVPPHYDSMIAKIVVHARRRDKVIARMRRALDATIIEGIKTTIPVHLQILADPDFNAGRYSTKFMERFLNGNRAGVTP